MLDRLESGMSLEGRFPFHDRRLIEVALALPEEQRCRGDQYKFILRRAAQELLPTSVRRRLTKAEFSYLYAETFARERVSDLFESLRLAADGYVNVAQAKEIYRRCCQGEVQYLYPVWMILATERWYGAMFPLGASTYNPRRYDEREP